MHVIRIDACPRMHMCTGIVCVCVCVRVCACACSESLHHAHTPRIQCMCIQVKIRTYILTQCERGRRRARPAKHGQAHETT
jgi:hypothetical protein